MNYWKQRQSEHLKAIYEIRGKKKIHGKSLLTISLHVVSGHTNKFYLIKKRRATNACTRRKVAYREDFQMKVKLGNKQLYAMPVLQNYTYYNIVYIYT